MGDGMEPTVRNAIHAASCALAGRLRSGGLGNLHCPPAGGGVVGSLVTSERTWCEPQEEAKNHEPEDEADRPGNSRPSSREIRAHLADTEVTGIEARVIARQRALRH